jgi:hypothetical protein
MQVTFGSNIDTGQNVIMDTASLINGHLQISGISGTGKTHQLRFLIGAMVESAAKMGQPLRIHVIDPHGDIEAPYASMVMFSEATRYGYNPLEINPDPDYGGVRRTIQKFIASISKQKGLGVKQEAVIRYLLQDLYDERGFKADDPATWVPDNPRTVHEMMRGREDRVYLDVPFDQKERFKELLREIGNGTSCGDFDRFDDKPELKHKKCWWVKADKYEGDLLMWSPKNLFKAAPNMDDAVRFVERKLKAAFCGANGACMALLQDLNKAVRAYHRKVDDLSKRGEALVGEELEELKTAVDKAKEKSNHAYASYLDAIATGRELDEVIRYNSIEVLTSVYERFQNLRATGIYSGVAPPFDSDSPVWRYLIKPLAPGVQQLLVDLICARIFERAINSGIKGDVVEIIVLDEAKRYLTDDDDDILQKIANEARKFGLALWLASQTPAHFGDDLLKATGTIIVLGLSAADTALVARKLGIGNDMLRKIVPHQTALVQLRKKGTLSEDFVMVRLNRPIDKSRVP